MLKFSEIFEFSKEKFRKFPILKEFEWFEWFEWFGPSPIEPFNSEQDQVDPLGAGVLVFVGCRRRGAAYVDTTVFVLFFLFIFFLLFFARGSGENTLRFF